MSWSDDNGDSHFANDYHRAQENRNNDVTTAYANSQRFDRLARGHRISPFPTYANVYHLSQDDMNLGSASSYDNRNDASKRRFFQAPISEDHLSGFNGLKLNELDKRNGSETSEHDAKRRVDASTLFVHHNCTYRLSWLGRVKVVSGDCNRVEFFFGDCIFRVNPSGLLTRNGSCSTESGGLIFIGMSIKELAPDVFSNLSSVR
jgi:hypothetical protein